MTDALNFYRLITLQEVYDRWNTLKDFIPIDGGSYTFGHYVHKLEECGFKIL